MSAQYVLALSDLENTPAQEVGTLGVKLADFDKRAIPIPNCLVIPHQTWRKLIEEWQLNQKLGQSHQNLNWLDPADRYRAKKEVISHLKGQVFPDWFTQPIAKQYHLELERGFVRLLAGSATSTLDVSRFEHIQGDANLFESLMHFWLKWVEHQLDLSASHSEVALTPTSVIIQEQALALASGSCHTYHPHSGSKSQVVISAIKGAPAPELIEEEADKYVVDTRTWNVIFRQVKAQTRQYYRTTDHLASKPVDHALQLEPNLSDAQCLELAQVVSHLKQSQLHQSKLDWELTPDGFVITHEEQLELDDNHKSANNPSTATKIMVEAGNPYLHQQSLPETADGIGLFKSYYAYLNFGMHPLQVIHNSQQEVLLRHLVDSVLQFHDLLPHKTLIYQALDVGSDTLGQLQQGYKFEQPEPNPFLGLRGGAKLISHPEMFKLELGVIHRLLNKTHVRVGLQLPFVRTPGELSQLIDLVYEAGLSSNPEFELWWQLDTPENIYNIHSYPVHHLTGLAVNAKSIQAILHAVDPTNPDIFEKYAFDKQSLIGCMQLANQYKTDSSELSFNNQRVQLRLQLEEFDRELVEEAVNLGYDGITVNARAFDLTKNVVVEAEQKIVGAKELRNIYGSY